MSCITLGFFLLSEFDVVCFEPLLIGFHLSVQPDDPNDSDNPNDLDNFGGFTCFDQSCELGGIWVICIGLKLLPDPSDVSYDGHSGHKINPKEEM